MTTLQFFVVLFVYPETKGITLEQLQRSSAWIGSEMVRSLPLTYIQYVHTIKDGI